MVGGLGLFRSLLVGRASLRSLSLVGDREKRPEKFRSLAGVADGDELRAAVVGVGVLTKTLSRLLRSPIVILVCTSDGSSSSVTAAGAKLSLTAEAPSMTGCAGSSPPLTGTSSAASPEDG